MHPQRRSKPPELGSRLTVTRRKLEQVNELAEDGKVDRWRIERQPRDPPGRPPAVAWVASLSEEHH